MPALDDLAADFPSLTIIGAHPSWPWQEEMLAIAVHKTNIYIDLSGWSPKYFSPSLIQYAKSLLQDRMLFGTDYPFLTPGQWLSEFDKLGFKPEVREKILLRNAQRLLSLSPEGTR
jgi:predicted TIM-barrel fold metal-dependent hydrolase